MIDPLDPNHPDAGLTPGSTSLTLLDRLRRRDPEGWRRHVRLYGPLIYRWCRRGRLQPEDAADVTQEVFRTVAARIDDFRRDRPGDSFRGWLWTITRHKIGDHLRRLRRQPDAAGGSDAQERWQLLPDPLPDDDDAAADFSDLVHRAMELVRRSSAIGPGRPSGGRPSKAARRRTWPRNWASLPTPCAWPNPASCGGSGRNCRT